MFGRLESFQKSRGNCYVPAHWAEDPSLGNWVLNQRCRRLQLSPDQVRRLDRLGFDWRKAPTRTHLWEQQFAEVKKFKARQGHCNVPAIWPENPRLGIWVHKQRFNQASLLPERRQQLDRLGFQWRIASKRQKHQAVAAGR